MTEYSRTRVLVLQNYTKILSAHDFHQRSMHDAESKLRALEAQNPWLLKVWELMKESEEKGEAITLVSPGKDLTGTTRAEEIIPFPPTTTTTTTTSSSSSQLPPPPPKPKEAEVGDKRKGTKPNKRQRKRLRKEKDGAGAKAPILPPSKEQLELQASDIRRPSPEIEKDYTSKFKDWK